VTQGYRYLDKNCEEDVDFPIALNPPLKCIIIIEIRGIRPDA